MNIFKVIEEEEIEVELVPVKCTKCDTPMMLAKKVVDKDEAFHCNNCRALGFVGR